MHNPTRNVARREIPGTVSAAAHRCDAVVKRQNRFGENWSVATQNHPAVVNGYWVSHSTNAEQLSAEPPITRERPTGGRAPVKVKRSRSWMASQPGLAHTPTHSPS